ncbi:MAG: GAF domain-containing protein [Spirochaetales bacterium]|nr:GAF domain-containing protein [Spirochaetales bacterium]
MPEDYEIYSHSELISKLERLQKKAEALDEENRSLETLKEALEVSESRYRTIFQGSQVSIWEEDFSEVRQALKEMPCNSRSEYSIYLEEHPEIVEKLISKVRIIDINEATVQLLRAESKEHLLSSLDSVFIPESFAIFKEEFIAIAMGEHHHECETIGTRMDGSTFHVFLTAYLPGEGEGSVLIGMMDITDRILREQEREKLLTVAEEHRQMADSLRDVSLALTSKINRADILDTILEHICKIVPCSSANIMLIKNSKLTVVRWAGYKKFGAEKFMSDFGEKISDMGRAPSLINDKLISIIPDTSRDPNWVHFPEIAYIKSFMAIPIIWQGNVIGLLNLDSDRKETFTRKDVVKLQPLADAAAAALQHSLLFERANQEISDRKETEKHLKRSLEEKEILLKEIHHRVKNNLAIIIALINLQSNRISDPSPLHLFEDLRQRIFAISLVHEKLYESHDLSSINFRTYVIELLESAKAVLCYRNNIEFQLDIPEEIAFEINTLVPLGLILNELITNALKYAFPEGEGKVLIKVKRTGNELVLTVKDTGIGFPEKDEPSCHLGLNLVESLAMQIGGSALYQNENGAAIFINFPCKTDINTEAVRGSP